MQIVIMNNQTFLTADSQGCLIDSGSESERIREELFGLNMQLFLMNADQRPKRWREANKQEELLVNRT